MNGHADIDIQTEVKTKTTVNINGYNLHEVMDLAVELAHTLLEEMSDTRNKGIISDDVTFYSEGLACRFLDMVGD